ncbi:TatD family nuclease-associated radical SAM protein [Halanaerobaculum tunisiense]
MTITYQLGNKLYINLTNRCSNDCKFCIRRFKDGVGDYDLWLDKEPTVDEVIANIDDVNQYQEIVFCGYGEPLMRINEVQEISQYLKENHPQISIRVNTNGQANLIHNENVLLKLEDLIDVISISLNASTVDRYQEICQSQFGTQAFKAVIEFIKEAKKRIPKVIVSVVASSKVDVTACKNLAQDLGVEFKVR